MDDLGAGAFIMFFHDNRSQKRLEAQCALELAELLRGKLEHAQCVFEPQIHLIEYYSFLG